MIYIGMDISSKIFLVHAIDSKKKVVFKGEVKPIRSGIRQMIKALGRETKLVVFEAGNQLKWIALALKKLPDVHFHVVHPNEIKWIHQNNAKTDKIDARKLSQLARGDLLPPKVHIVEGKVRQIRELVSARHTLQSKRVALINSLRGCLKQEGYRLPQKFFGRKDWRQQLERMRIGKTQKLIVESYMKSIESLYKAELALTDQIVQIENADISVLQQRRM